ncbi:MAG TPA: hypothetical protein V6D23_01345, partial [Candidatus Obscuribacterales bacterium]
MSIQNNPLTRQPGQTPVKTQPTDPVSTLPPGPAPTQTLPSASPNLGLQQRGTPTAGVPTSGQLEQDLDQAFGTAGPQLEGSESLERFAQLQSVLPQLGPVATAATGGGATEAGQSHAPSTEAIQTTGHAPSGRTTTITGQQVVQQADTTSAAAFNAVVAAVDADTSLRGPDGRVTPERRQEAIIDRYLQQACPRFAGLPAEQQQAIRQFLRAIPLDQLNNSQIQGAGGAAGGQGITGSGTQGHYTN